MVFKGTRTWPEAWDDAARGSGDFTMEPFLDELVVNPGYPVLIPC